MEHKESGMSKGTEISVPTQGESSLPQAANGRRRFLKGTTLALPAVMTLHSVAARATEIARTSLNCANNVPQNPCVHLRTQPDDYFRKKVACYDKLTKTWNSQKRKYVYTASGQATYYQGIRCTDQATCWRYVSTGEIVPSSEYEYINCPTNTNAQPSPSTCTPTKYCYAIVHFSSADGSVMGVGEPTTPVGCMMTSLSGACLKSLWGKAG